MFGNSPARSRQLGSTFSLLCIILLNIVIIGTVSINGSLNNQGRCNLYFRAGASGSPPTYNNGYCAIPTIVAIFLTIASIMFAGYEIKVVHRHEEYHPRLWSGMVICFAIVFALLSFAVCLEIALGIAIACNPQGQAGGSTAGGRKLDCLSHTPFGALYVAQVCSGLMGGLWLLVATLEWLQLKSQPLVGTIRSVREECTTVMPHTTEAPSGNHWHGDNSNLQHVYIPSVRPTMTTIAIPNDHHL